MVAYDSRRWPAPDKRLTDETVAALRAAISGQRDAGREPTPLLRDAVIAAARDARERAIPPESLLVQLKIVAEEAGVPPVIGADEGATALREWLVSACVSAYFSE
jgi:hypothetical protein